MDGQNLCMQQSSVSNKVLVQQSYQKLVISFVNLLFIMRGMFLYSAHSYYYFVIPLLNVHSPAKSIRHIADHSNKRKNCTLVKVKILLNKLGFVQ